LSCLLFKTRRFGYWILSPSSDGTYSSARDWDYIYLFGPTEKIPLEGTDRFQYLKCRFLKKRVDDVYIQACGQGIQKSIHNKYKYKSLEN
jgi:hypothetical protein